MNRREGLSLTEDKITCGRCCRCCRVDIIRENGKVYIDGNKCVGAEERVRECMPDLKDVKLYSARDRKKKKPFGTFAVQ